MEIMDYLNKSSQITLLDTLLIAVTSSILSIILVNLSKASFLVGGRWLLKLIKVTYHKATYQSRYNRRLKKGDLTTREYVQFCDKERDGTISELELHALNKVKESLEKRQTEKQKQYEKSE
ncbi:hypothetical protein [Domibacillus tundrae]|uniref:hypothetical protein n=1 Tax=Domibacillus tundrae TaxID=1587527 RepID=UPI0006183347|nr:hypothetical protein [Domibacillus tundrae]